MYKKYQQVTPEICKDWLLRAYIDSKTQGKFVAMNFETPSAQTLGMIALRAGLCEDNGTGRRLVNLDRIPTDEDAELLDKKYHEYRKELRTKYPKEENTLQVKVGPYAIEVPPKSTLEDKVDYLIELAEKLAKVWGCKP